MEVTYKEKEKWRNWNCRNHGKRILTQLEQRGILHSSLPCEELRQRHDTFFFSLFSCSFLVFLVGIRKFPRKLPNQHGPSSTAHPIIRNPPGPYLPKLEIWAGCGTSKGNKNFVKLGMFVSRLQDDPIKPI